VNTRTVHALDAAGGFAAVCRSRVTVTSDVSRDDAQVTCEECRLRLKCPACGWPIPVSVAAVFTGGRRYHIACAGKLDDTPSSRR
jgi:hypothetical protein